MSVISPHDLATLLGDTLSAPLHDLPETPFHNLVIDSRKAEPGDLFVALRGEHTDGHHFLNDAVARGAIAVLARVAAPDAPPATAATAAAAAPITTFAVEDTLAALQQAAKRWRARQPARVAAITGSVGKTTAREAIAQVLRRKFPTLESPHNFNSETGLPIALLGLGSQHEWAVIEIGPYGSTEMQTLCEIAAADIAVVTNVGPTHLERFGSIEATEQIKGALPASLPADGVAILNLDDERVARMRQRTSARVLTYGRDTQADVRATDVETHGLESISFTLHLHGEQRPVRVPLAGAHHVMTALAAAAVALSADFTPAEIGDALETLTAGSRLKPRRSYSGAQLLDDTYNAAPASMKAALDLLAEMPGRRIAVLGEMLELGSVEVAAHHEVGAYAMGRCDRLIAVGPRAQAIADGAWDAGHREIQWYEDKAEVAALLRREIGADDVVLLKASHGLALETVVEALVTP